MNSVRESKFTNHQKAILALVLANIIWGAASPIFKWSLQNIEPFTLAFLRFFLASLILLPFSLKHLKVEREDWFTLLALSLFGVTFNIAFFFFGLELAPAINAPIIATAGPIFLLLGCFLFLHEKIKRKTIIGTTIGSVGVLLVILRPIFEEGFDLAVLGNLFFVVATLGGVFQAILTKKIIPKYNPLTLTFWSFVIGSLTFIPFFGVEVIQSGFLPNLAFPGLIGIIFGALLSSAIAYFFFIWAIKYLPAQNTGVFTYLDPFVAILIAIPLLGEKLTPIYLLGALLVFLGILIAEGRLPYHPFHQWKNLV